MVGLERKLRIIVDNKKPDKTPDLESQKISGYVKMVLNLLTAENPSDLKQLKELEPHAKKAVYDDLVREAHDLKLQGRLEEVRHYQDGVVYFRTEVMGIKVIK